MKRVIRAPLPTPGSHFGSSYAFAEAATGEIGSSRSPLKPEDAQTEAELMAWSLGYMTLATSACGHQHEFDKLVDQGKLIVIAVWIGNVTAMPTLHRFIFAESHESLSILLAKPRFCEERVSAIVPTKTQ